MLTRSNFLTYIDIVEVPSLYLIARDRHLSGRVSGVDDDDGLDVAMLPSGGDGALQLGHIQGPVPLLIQVVAHLPRPPVQPRKEIHPPPDQRRMLTDRQEKKEEICERIPENT
jgi:hypothetical protein